MDDRPKTDEEILEAAMKLSRSVARRVDVSARGVLPYDDLVAEGYLWIAKHPKKIKQWAEQEHGFNSVLSVVLYRVMQKAVARERAAISGSPMNDQYYYSSSIIEQALEQIWSGERENGGLVDDGQPRKKKVLSESGDWEAILADVSRAVDRLPANDAVLLRQRYQMNLPLASIASLHRIHPSSAARRVEHLITTLIDLLGGESPWRDRRPRGNAHAQAITRNTEGSGE